MLQYNYPREVGLAMCHSTGRTSDTLVLPFSIEPYIYNKDFLMKKGVLLLSGGLDSSTVLAFMQSQGFDVYALSFSYGQKHDQELEIAKKIAKLHNVKQHEIIDLNFGALAHSSLTSNDIHVSDYDGSQEIPSTYVPARNTVFLSIALGWAESIGAFDVFAGVSAIDYSGYPDCRPEYINAFQNMANLANKTGVEGNPIKINTPLIALSKAETIKIGHQLGVNYGLTVSCYRLNAQKKACGTCDSCVLRKQGFEQAGVPDPTHYVLE